MALITSVFKMLKIKIYLKNESILKIGQFTTEMIIVLEGKVNVFGMYQNKILGQLTEGSHFGNDLCELSENMEDHFESELPLDEMDNFNSISTFNLSATSFTVIGILSTE